MWKRAVRRVVFAAAFAGVAWVALEAGATDEHDSAVDPLELREQVARGQPWVLADEHAASSGNSKIRLERLQAVVGQERDALTVAGSQASKRRRELTSPAQQLAVGQLTLRVADRA